MTYFHLYCDETGLEDLGEGGVLRVVGLLAPHNFWPVFNQQWVNALTVAPFLRYWHTRGAANLEVQRTPGEGIQDPHMTSPEIEAKEYALAEVLRRNASSIVAIDVELPMRSFRTAEKKLGPTPSRKVRRLGALGEKARTPLFVAMSSAIAEALPIAFQWNAVIRPNEPMQLWSVFERDRSRWELEYQLTETMLIVNRLAPERARDMIGPVLFVIGKGPLAYTTTQAADLFAFHLAKSVRDGRPTEVWRRYLDAIRLHKLEVSPDRAAELMTGIREEEPPAAETGGPELQGTRRPTGARAKGATRGTSRRERRS